MPERNPRLDPRPGDVVAGRGKNLGARRVNYVTLTGRVYYDVEGSLSSQKYCDRETWQKWTRGGRVLHTGGAADAFDIKPHPIPRPIHEQINGLANGWTHTLKKGVSTPWDETFAVIIELGLERALEIDGRRILHEELHKHVAHEDCDDRRCRRK